MHDKLSDEMETAIPQTLLFRSVTDYILAVECGHYRLLLNGCEHGQPLDAWNFEALRRAVVQENYVLTCWLLYFGMLTNISLAPWIDMTTHCCELPVLACDAPKMLGGLLAAGGDPNTRDDYGNTMLYTACSGDEELRSGEKWSKF
jgi:hypothetical protein